MSIGSINEIQQLKWPYGATEQIINGQTTATRYTYGGTLTAGHYAFSGVSLDSKAAYLVIQSASNNTTVRIKSGQTAYFKLPGSASDIVLESEGSVPTAESDLFTRYAGSDRPQVILYGNSQFVLPLQGQTTYVYRVNNANYPSGALQQVNVGRSVNWGVYAQGKWAFAGEGALGGFSTSTDLSTWSYNALGSGANIRSLRYLNGGYVAVGDFALYTSTDALTWTARTSTNLLSGSCWSMATGVSVMLAGSQSSPFITGSSDGIGWSYKTAVANSVREIAFINNVFVVAAASGNLYSSTNGNSWTTRSPSFGSSLIYSVAFGNGVYVAGGAGGRLTSSTDLVTWTVRTSNFGTTIINGLAYGAGSYVAVGAAGRLTQSTDAVTWTVRTSNFGTSAINRVRWFSTLNQFIAVGAGGRMTTSTDGVTWNAVTTSGFGSSVIWEVTYYNGYYVASGAGGTIRYSTDAVTWNTPSWPSGQPSVILYALAAISGRLYAAGASGTIFSSTDAVTWDTNYPNVAGGTIPTYMDVAYHNGKYYALGSGTPSLVSTNGTTWTTDSGISGSGIFSDGSRFVVFSGTSVSTSTDAVTWTAQTALASNANDVFYANGLYVAGGGTGFLATSTDLTTWTTRTYAPGTGSSIHRFAVGATGQWAAVDGLNNGPTFSTDTGATTWVKGSFDSQPAAGANSGTTVVVSAGGASFYAPTSTLANWTRVAVASEPATSQTLALVYGKNTSGGDAWALATTDQVYASTDALSWSPVTTVGAIGKTVIWDSTNSVFLAGSGTTAENVTRFVINSTGTITANSWSLGFLTTTSLCTVIAANDGWYLYATNNGNGEVAIGRDYQANTTLMHATLERSLKNPGQIRGAAIGPDFAIVATNRGSVYRIALDDAARQSSYVENVNVSGGASSTTTNRLEISEYWKECALPFASASGNPFVSAIYNNGTYAVLDDTGRFCTSTDAITWTLASIGLPSTANYGAYSSLNRFSDNQYIIGAQGALFYTTGGELPSAYSLYKISLPTL